MKKYICFDIGGTAIKYGIINEKARIIQFSEIPTEAAKGGRAIQEKVLHIVDTLRKDSEISGVGISTAGIIDIEKGEVAYASHLIPNYIGINYTEKIEELFGIPCEVENDVNCAGLAEYVSGVAKEYRNFVMLTIGTGIGGCLFLDGKMIHGSSFCACEVGRMYMNDSDFQTLGSASILSKRVAAMKNDVPDNWNGIRIFEAAKQGDEACNHAINEMCEVLGKGIANICYVVNPELVILGGGIMAQKEFLRLKIENAVHKYLNEYIGSATKIEYAYHNNQAGMLGAYYHFRNRRG